MSEPKVESTRCIICSTTIASGLVCVCQAPQCNAAVRSMVSKYNTVRKALAESLDANEQYQQAVQKEEKKGETHESGLRIPEQTPKSPVASNPKPKT